MMVHVSVVVAAVEAHLGWVRALRCGLQLADLLEAYDLGPKLVGFLQIANVQHQMVQARGCDRTGFGGIARGHVLLLICVEAHGIRFMCGGAWHPSAPMIE
jgi:hypothetical protein